MCVVGRNILIVGVAGKSQALMELPIRVLAMDTSAKAIRCLKEEKIDTVVSHWKLINVPAGKFLRHVSEARFDNRPVTASD